MTAPDGSVLGLDQDGSGGVDHQFPAEATAVRDARRILGAWLTMGAGIDGERRAELLLVASEMASNAVRAGSTWFRLRAWREPSGVAVEVADDGPGFDALLPALDDVPAVEAENGRGLFLVRTLVDRCTIFTAETGTIVRCRIDL
jgi:anti-sigma regulatory factor (Ser/Thr protein kinase)